MSRYLYVGKDKYPEQQKELLNRVVIVMLQFDSKMPLRGKILRADKEAPNEVVIQLDDNRIVLGSECSYKLAVEADG